VELFDRLGQDMEIVLAKEMQLLHDILQIMSLGHLLGWDEIQKQSMERFEIMVECFIMLRMIS
jgi:hypothetical protein